jgi:hypothetical protein
MSEPKFARRHYEAIAEIMRRTQSNNDGGGADIWWSIREELTNLFAADNPRFHRSRFKEACEP